MSDWQRSTIPAAVSHGATLPYRLNLLPAIVVTFSTIVAYQKARETRITACRSLSQNARPAAGMYTRQIPPQLTHGATLPYRLNVLHVIVVTFSTVVAYPKKPEKHAKRPVGHCHRMRDPPPVCRQIPPQLQ